MIGREISHYRISEPVSEGGMGAVYKGEDLTLHRTVAIKVVKPTSIDPETASKRFLREAQIVSQIEHPNVITLFDVVQKGEENYIVMQYVQGRSLRQRMRESRLPLREAVAIAQQVASGLEAAHGHGVIHRDIKPENVMMDGNGLCKIVDFGLARLVERSTLTKKGNIVGTMPYMSPEQLQGDEVDGRTDIYSLGVLLYEMLSGRLPFEHEKEAALFYQILNVDAPPLAEADPTLPVEIQAIVSRAMAKEPAERYASVSEMRHDLDVVLSRMSGDDALEKMYARLPRSRRFITVAAVLAVSVVAIALWRLWPHIPHPGGKGSPRIMVARAANTMNSTELDYLSGAIMDGFIGALSRLQGYQVVARPTVSTAMQTLSYASAIPSPGELVDVAQRVGADYLVTASYAPAGTAIRMSCALSSVRDGVVVDSWSEEITRVETDLFPAVQRFASDIASTLGARWKRGAETEGVARASLSESVPALRAYERGLSYYEVGNTPAAVEQLKVAVQEDSVFPSAYLYLSMLEPDQDESSRYLTLAMKYRRQAESPVGDMIMARYLTNTDRIDEAIRTYNAILTGDPEQVLARKSLADLYIRERRFEDALAEFQVLQTTSPLDYSFYPSWWIAACETGRTADAHRLLDRWRARFPREEAPLRELIGYHLLLGQYDEIPALCDTLDAIHADASAMDRGACYALLGRMRDAEKLYRALLDSPDPYLARSHGLSALANHYYKMGEYARGIAVIREAHDAQPDYYNAWIAGLLAAAMGDTAAAQRYAEEIHSLFAPGEGDTTLVESFAYRRFYYHLLGEIALAGGDTRRAVAMHQKAVRYSMRLDGPFFRSYLARAYFAANDRRRSEATFEQVLSINPNYPEALLGLGECYVLDGKDTRARHTLQHLRQLWKDADSDYRLNVRLNQLLAETTRQ